MKDETALFIERKIIPVFVFVGLLIVGYLGVLGMTDLYGLEVGSAVKAPGIIVYTGTVKKIDYNSGPYCVGPKLITVSILFEDNIRFEVKRPNIKIVKIGDNINIIRDRSIYKYNIE